MNLKQAAKRKQQKKTKSKRDNKQINFNFDMFDPVSSIELYQTVQISRNPTIRRTY